MTARRNDDDWTSDLASDDVALRDDAVRDLRDMLCRGLAKSLSNHWPNRGRFPGRCRPGGLHEDS
jgi:hypothetical protein